METSKAKPKTKDKAKSKTGKTTGAGKSVKSKKVTAIKSGPGEEEIRLKAREIYHERIGRGEHGTAEQDWLKAEQFFKRSGK
jgi:hypothetical protein